MAGGETVRASRDGDRFHYYWAARRALHLLDPNGGLHAVGVEGLPEGEEVPDEEVIDVAEYYGGLDAATATRVRYSQLKHSTMRVDVPIVASELKKTLEKFAEIYREAAKDGWGDKLEFQFVANRSLNRAVRESLGELAAGAVSFTYDAEARLLRRYMAFPLTPDLESDFCNRLNIADGEPGISDIEQQLRADLAQVLPGGGAGPEMALLMETISRCATSLVDSQTLTAADVLVSLRTSSEELRPAPSSIETPAHIIETQDARDVAAAVVAGPQAKILVTAIGGNGKSILASNLQWNLPDGSVTVVYDCFAGGDYRRVTSRRHEHHVAITQMSNELAAQSLCSPLVPVPATAAQYTKAFMRRVERAARQIANRTPGAILAIVIDAADNAAMVADELRDRTFVTDLFREDWPENARVIQLCRPERKHLLDAPNIGVTELQLNGFQKEESFRHFRSRFPHVTVEEAAELHVLSDGNPRVQAMAMENAPSVLDVLHTLELAKVSSSDVLDELLAQQVSTIADQGHLRPDEFSRLCRALAILHPPIPLLDLAEATQVDANAIKGFAVALGRGLYAAGEVLQFRDEPTETWFRNTYGSSLTDKKQFVNSLMHLTDTSAYVANGLPQLLFESEMFNELVDLALSNSGLPGAADELRAQEIARSRARFALSAMLRTKRFADAATLAVSAGNMSSGHSRTMGIFRANTDLAGRFLGAEVVDRLCSGRELTTDWPGSNLHVEAALLSHDEVNKELVRSRIRSALTNLAAVSRGAGTTGTHHDITAADVADLAMAALNIDGPDGAFMILGRCHPKAFVREVAGKVCGRLADAGRLEDLYGLCVPGRRHKPLHAAIAETLFDYNLFPPSDVLRTLVRTLSGRRKPYKRVGELDNEPDTRGVVWVVVHGLRSGYINGPEAKRILDIHLPAHIADTAGERTYTPLQTSSLLGHALRAQLTDGTLAAAHVASDAMRKQLKASHGSDRTTREFRSNILRLLPWADLWLVALLDGGVPRAIERFKRLAASDLQGISSYDTPFVFVSAVAEIATRIVSLEDFAELRASVETWYLRGDAALARSSSRIARFASRSPHLQSFGLEVASSAAERVQRDRADADSRVASLVDLARSVLAVNEPEAAALFEAAVAEARQVGDDLSARWHSLLHTARALNSGTDGARALRLHQVAERLEREFGEMDELSLGERLRSMHEPTYFCLLSRSRDRRTFGMGDLLTAVFKSSGDDRVSPLAFAPFGPRRRQQNIATRLSGDSDAASVMEEFYSHERTADEIPRSSYAHTSMFDRSTTAPPRPIADRFAGVDFTSDRGWDEALAEVGWSERMQLASFALDKHPHERPAVLNALADASKATMRDFVDLAAAAAASQPLSPGLRLALRNLAISVATRFARRISTWIWQDDDLTSLAENSGVTVRDLMTHALHEIGGTAYDLEYADYFHLAAVIATAVEPGASARTFDALSGLFEDLAPSTADTDELLDFAAMPENALATGIAGVIWAALSDIDVKTRWRAAHSVLLLVRLGCDDELAALLRFADGRDDISPFTDRRFPFYSLHARMWLLFALARGALESNAAVLVRFVPFLLSIVREKGHAANQVLAQRALAALVTSGVVAVDGEIDQALNARLVATWVEMDWHEQAARREKLSSSSDDTDEEEDDDKFFFDYEAYWCNGLANVFGYSEKEIRQCAARYAIELDESALFVTDTDPRSDAGVYDDGRAYPDRGEWPKQDNHGFYIAVHALLSVAAELADTETAFKEPESTHDSYHDWLADYLPYRPDGRWLADRRDHPPTPAPDLGPATYEPKDEWPWSVRKTDFERVAGAGSDWITVWSDSSAAHGELCEDTNVESVLVPHEAARALLIALQTSPSGPHVRIAPASGDTYERPSEYPFEIRPWVDTMKYHSGIDDRDERAAGVEFPPPSPGRDIVEKFGLSTDIDRRRWLYNGTEAFRTLVWSDMTVGVYNREIGTRGECLDIHRDYLTRVLTELDMTLVVQVGLRRYNLDRSHYGTPHRRRGDSDHEFGWLNWSGKVYLIGPDGHWLEY